MFETQFPIMQCDLMTIRKYAGVVHILNAVRKAVLLRSTHPSKNHANIGPIDVVASIMLVLVLCTAFPKHNLLKIYPFTSLIRHKPRSSQDASQGYKIRAALHCLQFMRI